MFGFPCGPQSLSRTSSNVANRLEFGPRPPHQPFPRSRPGVAKILRSVLLRLGGNSWRVQNGWRALGGLDPAAGEEAGYPTGGWRGSIPKVRKACHKG